ncbi:MAG: sigma-70 family RNA polymerase sigma factor [Gemmataceae bacterium]|nr:sigma-70 family RNA polymerase sigma factor [Gemmataceae bacterium]
MDPLFQRSYPQLLAWCRRHVRPDLGDPEDLVHEAYLLCRRHWSASKQSSHCGIAYFYRALRWVRANAVRRSQRPQLPGALGDSDDLPSSPESPLGELIAREALSLLTGKQRDVCLGFLRGQRPHELRAELHLSPAALAVYACRAHRKLRQHLAP